MSRREQLNRRFHLQFSFDSGAPDWVPIVPIASRSSQPRRDSIDATKARPQKESPPSDLPTYPDRTALARQLMLDPTFPNRETLMEVAKVLARSFLGELD
jgi:hypothetical protein